MSRFALMFAYCALLWSLYPSAAHAYLMPLIGLIGALGGVVGIIVTAVLSVGFLFFFHGKQLKRLFSRKKSEGTQPDASGDVKSSDSDPKP